MSREGGYARRNELPFIHSEGWRTQAECDYTRDPVTFEPLWDDRVDGETDRERKSRHERARAICDNVCPVREKCSDEVDWRTDEGIRGGHKLPSLDQSRTPAEDETLRLLRKGWTLDRAARRSSWEAAHDPLAAAEG